MLWSQIKCLIILIVDDAHLLSTEYDSDADKDYLPENNNNNDTDSHSGSIES